MKTTLKTVNVREFQHNLAMYIDLAKATPISVTKHGKQEVLIVNPDIYELKEKEQTSKKSFKIMESDFIGMHKDNKDWKNKSSAELAQELRESAWYGN